MSDDMNGHRNGISQHQRQILSAIEAAQNMADTTNRPHIVTYDLQVKSAIHAKHSHWVEMVQPCRRHKI
ncbi:MAG: hypothetical protein EB165_06975 [Euryarchaeota archaeon]|nr:hypothetical protein [Euryarchaeota archaeon]